MKWVTHQSLAVTAAFVLNMPLEGVLAVWVGSTLPDVLEQRFIRLFGNRQKAFNRVHRGWTHWFGVWLMFFIRDPLHPFPPFIGNVLFGLGFGGLSHVLLDMCTPVGVPLLPWSRKKKFSLKLCKTGGIVEYMFLVIGLFVLGCALPDVRMLFVRLTQALLGG